jgi:glycosyltransferase involved in cell wall biosynthesis
MVSSLDGGGSEQQTLLLLKHLDRRRFAPELYLLRRSGTLLDQVPPDVPIHCFTDAANRSAEKQHDRPTAKLASAIKRLPLPGKIHRQQVEDLARLLAQRKIDVIYDRTFHMTLIAGEAALLAGVPRVSTIVSPPSRAVPLNAGRFLSIKIRRLRNAYRQASAVIAVSHPTARDAAAFYQLPRSRFTVVANPVDSAALDQILAATPRPSRDSRYTIACVGRISIEKGQQELVQAMKKLRSDHPEEPLPRVWMIGDGPLRTSLQQSVQNENLADSIEFIGHVAQPAPWIAASDAVCITSHFEGFPNVMLEAMAMGVPVIARSIDVVRSLGRIAVDPSIRGRTYVTTFKSSPENMGFDLARKMVRSRTNSTATRSKTTSARRLAREELSIANGIARIERILIKAFVDRLAE